MNDENATPTGESSEFARLLTEEPAAKTFQPGQQVRGTVVQIGAQDVFLDVGGKSEATLPLVEVTDDKGEVTVKLGDSVEAVVSKISADGILLTRRLSRGRQALEAIENAMRNGLPVEGKVQSVIKGGFEVIVAGHRTFCPMSQIDLRRADDPNVWVGQTLEFRILELKDRGRSIVVSRRKILEESAAAAAEETWKKIFPGAVLIGTVASLADFGAFVDLGGVQGLVHISEISYERISRPADALKVGDQVTVKVLRVDTEKGRVSLSLKAMAENPWEAAAARLREGDVVTGRLVRVTDFGAFVELAPGVDGLAHVSTATPAFMAAWKGQAASRPEVRVRILRVDTERKRISLEPAD